MRLIHPHVRYTKVWFLKTFKILFNYIIDIFYTKMFFSVISDHEKNVYTLYVKNILQFSIKKIFIYTL